jgi:signal transduction histidine kinase
MRDWHDDLMGATSSASTRILRAPFTRRALHELLYCLVTAPLGLVVPICGIGFVAAAGYLAPGPAKPANASVGGLVGALLLLVVLATPVSRRLSEIYRRLAAALLSERVPGPSPLRPTRGVPRRLEMWLRDGVGWRAAGYLLLKVPLSVLQLYAVGFWVAGLVNISYPFWWALFRNHPPDVHLRPVPVITPLTGRTFEVATYPGTLLVFMAGVAAMLAAPWVTTAVTFADRWLIRALLGPDELTQRVRDLERTRALAVDDSAARLRRLERDLHDGAQIRLATLAMNLGMAKEKLDEDDQPDLTQIRNLVGSARQGAKDALNDLRDLVRGIHPPVLDVGLAEALTTLAATSAVPVQLTVNVPERPSPAIETIAYYCAAELLTNAAKHSFADTITVEVGELGRMLRVSVTDDGIGGADPDRGSGLSGLVERMSPVDGRLELSSPPGGPTRVVVHLPLRP